MNYSYENLAIDKTKINYLQRCFYLINLIKAKDYDLWENFKAQYENTKAEESWDFYQLLVEEYRKLTAPPALKNKKVGNLKIVGRERNKQVEKKAVKKKAPARKKAVAKKTPAKKTAAKKKSPSKTAKKSSTK